MTARIAIRSSAGKYTAGLGTYPDWGLPQRHRAIPSAALDERQCVVDGVYSTIERIHCQVFFAFLENFFVSCYNEPTHRRALYPYCIRLDKMSQQPLSGGPASPYICRST